MTFLKENDLVKVIVSKNPLRIIKCNKDTCDLEDTVSKQTYCLHNSLLKKIEENLEKKDESC